MNQVMLKFDWSAISIIPLTYTLAFAGAMYHFNQIIPQPAGTFAVIQSLPRMTPIESNHFRKGRIAPILNYSKLL